LVVFDLDGTLTPVVSLWRYLHDAFGTWSQGASAAERYMRGEISYTEWAETDAKYWAGVKLSALQQVLDRIPCQQGATEVFSTLRERDIRTAIVSAGLSVLADKVAEEVGADFSISNELMIDEGILTGGITVKVAVDEKGKLIEQIADDLAIPMNEVALVGDQANDLCIPECLRIAFKPKDELARRVDFVIEDGDLSTILQYLQ
jgi:phosphoserine phosphatase